jgi:hypothetical protein
VVFQPWFKRKRSFPCGVFTSSPIHVDPWVPKKQYWDK